MTTHVKVLRITLELHRIKKAHGVFTDDIVDVRKVLRTFSINSQDSVAKIGHELIRWCGLSSSSCVIRYFTVDNFEIDGNENFSVINDADMLTIKYYTVSTVYDQPYYIGRQLCIKPATTSSTISAAVPSTPLTSSMVIDKIMEDISTQNPQPVNPKSPKRKRKRSKKHAESLGSININTAESIDQTSLQNPDAMFLVDTSLLTNNSLADDSAPPAEQMTAENEVQTPQRKRKRKRKSIEGSSSAPNPVISENSSSCFIKVMAPDDLQANDSVRFQLLILDSITKSPTVTEMIEGEVESSANNLFRIKIGDTIALKLEQWLQYNDNFVCEGTTLIVKWEDLCNVERKRSNDETVDLWDLLSLKRQSLHSSC